MSASKVSGFINGELDVYISDPSLDRYVLHCAMLYIGTQNRYIFRSSFTSILLCVHHDQSGALGHVHDASHYQLHHSLPGQKSGKWTCS